MGLIGVPTCFMLKEACRWRNLHTIRLVVICIRSIHVLLYGAVLIMNLKILNFTLDKLWCVGKVRGVLQ